MRTWLAVVALAVMSPGLARADSKADELFAKAKKLLDKKKYQEACKTFEEVDELEPAIGSKLMVGKCYEEWGKLARAHGWYTDAEKMASDAKDPRAPKITELVTKLDPEVPRLTIRAPDNFDFVSASITVDNEPMAVRWLNSEQRVDPGPHEITYKTGGKKKSKTVALERGGAREVTLELEDKPEPKPDKDKDKDQDKDQDKDKDTQLPPPVADPGRNRRFLGLGVAGAGVVGVTIASIVTLSARGEYKDAIDAHCMGMTNACDNEGLKITRDARSTANVATVITLISVAAIGGGIFLYVTAPKSGPRETPDESALYIAPSLSNDGGGIVLGGGF